MNILRITLISIAALVLIVLIVLFIAAKCQRDGEPSIYLIPEGFTGRTTIFLGHSEGMPKEYEGKHRVFRIDENGCCVSQFEPQYGKWSVNDFYLVDKNGKRELLDPYPNFKTYEEDTTGLKRIFHKSGGDLKPERPDIHFYSFIVCTAPEYNDWVDSDIDYSCLDNYDKK